MFSMVVKNEPVKYVVFEGGEEVAADEVSLIFSSFGWNTNKELRDYEIDGCSTALSVLVKYGYLHNWVGSRMADMYKLSERYVELNDSLDGKLDGVVSYSKDVHTEHCCVRHGYKYEDDMCTVDSEREEVESMMSSDPKYKVAYENNAHFRSAVDSAVKKGVFEAMYEQSVLLENVVIGTAT